MRKTVLLCALLLTACAAGLQADSQGQQWFVEFSTGTGSSRGPLEMADFYRPAFSLAWESGYWLYPWLAVVPVSFNCHIFSFDSGSYERNYLNYIDAYDRKSFEELLEDLSGYYIDLDPYPPRLTAIEAASNLWAVSFTPSLLFQAPVSTRLSASVRMGAGIHHIRASLKQLLTMDEEDVGRYTIVSRTRGKKSGLGVLLGSGMEYALTDRVALTFRADYNLIFTRESKKPVRLKDTTGLWFFKTNGDNLQYHRFLTEKNTGIFEVKAGMRVNLQ
ncbi:MAG: hypothetical protein V1794_15765 [Candidatus Glassbacteria bacterium]